VPTYDYACRSCGHTFEAFQGITEGKLRKCPECGRLKLERLIGAGAGIVFKGSGFYETDYKRAEKPGSSSEPTGDKAGKSGEKAEPTPKSDKTASGKKDAGGGAKGKTKPDSSSGSGSSDKKGS